MSTPWKKRVQRWRGLRCLNEDRCKYIFAVMAHRGMDLPQTCGKVVCMILQHGLSKTVGGKRVEGEVFPSRPRKRIYSLVSRLLHAPAEICVSATRQVEFENFSPYGEKPCTSRFIREREPVPNTKLFLAENPVSEPRWGSPLHKTGHARKMGNVNSYPEDAHSSSVSSAG